MRKKFVVIEKENGEMKKIIENIRVRKRIFILSVAILVIAVATGVYVLHQNSHVQFEDKNMGIVICNTIGGEITPQNIRYKDLERVKTLQTGYVGFYNTLADIKKCKNLEKIYINSASFKGDPCYEVTGEKTGKKKTPEEVEELQKELEGILPQLRNLKEFSFTNVKKNCEITNIKFIKGCKKIESLWMYYVNVIDYSSLKYCSNLKEIDLWGSRIKEADSILELRELEEICLNETPLAQDRKEMEKLYEMFPNTKIIVE